MNGRPLPSAQRQAQRRGRPVIMLAMLIGGWSLLRAATWEGPVELEQVLLPVAGEAVQPGAETQATPRNAPLPQRRAGDPLAAPPTSLEPLRLAPQSPELVPAPVPPTAPAIAPVSSQRMAAGHAMLMAAGFGAMQLPPELAAYFAPRSPGAPATAPARPAGPARTVALAAPFAAPSVAPAPADAPRRASRWSADGWLLWRDDATTPINSGRPT